MMMTNHLLFLTDSFSVSIPFSSPNAFFTCPLPQVEGNQRDDTGASAILVAAEVGRHQVIPSLLQPLGEVSERPKLAEYLSCQLVQKHWSNTGLVIGSFGLSASKSGFFGLEG